MFFALVMESGKHFISGHLQRHTLHFRVDVDENKTYRLDGSSKFIFYYGSTSSYRSTISSIIVFCLSTYFFWRRSTICAFHPISVNLDQNGKLCISTTTTTILWLRVFFLFHRYFELCFYYIERLHGKFNRRFILN